MKLKLTVRDLEPTDLTDLDWSGGVEHQRALAEALQDSWAGLRAVLVIVLANGRLAAVGSASFPPDSDTAVLTMLSVHEHLQSLGLGTRLVAALEDRSRAEGRTRTQLAVEHDNPRAATLYRRLGYTEVGSRVEHWPAAGGRTYVTVSTLLERDLHAVGASVAAS